MAGTKAGCRNRRRRAGRWPDQRRKGYTEDTKKYNELGKAGWKLLRYTTDDLKKRPVQIIEEVLQSLK
jgi:very-short-patch-repair endonuclease